MRHEPNEGLKIQQQQRSIPGAASASYKIMKNKQTSPNEKKKKKRNNRLSLSFFYLLRPRESSGVIRIEGNVSATTKKRTDLLMEGNWVRNRYLFIFYLQANRVRYAQKGLHKWKINRAAVDNKRATKKQDKPLGSMLG